MEKEGIMFAIYNCRTNTHIGNVRAISEKDAISKYAKEANVYSVNRYKAIKAVKKLHY